MKISEHEQVGPPMISIYDFMGPTQYCTYAPLACKHP